MLMTANLNKYSIVTFNLNNFLLQKKNTYEWNCSGTAQLMKQNKTYLSPDGFLLFIKFQFRNLSIILFIT